MATNNGIEKDKSFFGNFEPKDVFIWLDGPRTFALLDQDGELCFAHWLQDVGSSWQYVVVPITDRILKQLNHGELSLRDVLLQPRIYLVDVSMDFSVERILLTSWEHLPQEALPRPGTMIRRELEPSFRITSNREIAALPLTVREQHILNYMKDGQEHTLSDITKVVGPTIQESSIGKALASLRDKGLIESDALV